MKMHLIALAAAAGTANAGLTVVQMDTFSGTPDFENTSTFDKFDGSLGTLLGVDITLELSVDGGFLEVDNDGVDPATAEVEFGASGVLSSGDVNLFPSPSVTSSNSQVFNLGIDDGDGPGVQSTGSDYGILNGTPTTNSMMVSINNAFLADYIGAGDSYDILADIDQTIDFGGVSGVAGAFDPQTADVKITVVYNYVPSPGSLALLGMGGLAAVRRRR